MPFKSRDPLLHLEPASLTTVDTNNVMNLHGLWSVFSRCAETLEEGKRLENLTWRVFSREAFVCRSPSGDHQPRLPPRLRSEHSKQHRSLSDQVPELSSSVNSNDSSDSDGHMELAIRSCPTSARPELRRAEFSDTRNGRKEKHISPFDLEKIVISIKERTALEPLSPLPASLSLPATKEPEPQPVPAQAPAPAPADHGHADLPQSTEITPTPSSPPTESSSSAHIIPDSSTSTVATAVTTSDISEMSPPLGTSGSTSTEISATSIVRGFSKDNISSCYRSHTQLAPTPTQSILKASPVPRAEPPPKKKAQPTFIVGGSSGEGDESSFETRYGARSSLSEGLRRSNNKKTTSFKDEVSTRMIQDKMYESEEVFEDSDEEEEDQSESAIEDEDVDEEWEDEEEASNPPMDEKEMFQRVDSRPHLTSRRSLLTTQLHEGDRAAALQNAASKSTSAIRRSRNTSPNGPMGTSPPQNLPPAFRAQASRARPIIMTTSNTQAPALLSPRTTRRNMLQTELTESLRKHLLWERQVKGSTTNAVLKRRHTSNDIKNLKEYPNAGNTAPPAPHFDPMNDKLVANANSWNNYFDSGLQEYHQKGW